MACISHEVPDLSARLPRFVRRFGPALAALLALLPAPLAAQRETPADKASAPVPAVKAVKAKPALWVVKDKDTTIYLFGTIHLLKPGIDWFGGPVSKAFAGSQELVLEIADQGDVATQQRVARRAMAIGGPSLTEKLPEAMRPKFTQLLTDYQMPAAVVNRMKPWFAAVTLTSVPLQKLGFDPGQGVETQLRKHAAARAMPIGGLETTEEQLGFFEGLSDEMQIELLVETINEQTDVGNTLDRMIAAWSAGDVKRLELSLNQSMEKDAELAKLLLFDRNERWADWIKARLEKPGTVFMAVGAGHLAGKGSVQDALKARRIKTKRVKSL